MTREEIVAEVREKGTARMETAYYNYVIDDISDDDKPESAYWLTIEPRNSWQTSQRLELWPSLEQVAQAIIRECEMQLKLEAYDAAHQ